MARPKSLEELEDGLLNIPSSTDVWMRLHLEAMRRLRKLAEWAASDRHGHATEKAAAEVRLILEGRDDAR